MSRRFPRLTRSIPDNRGRKATKIDLYTFNYKNYCIEYQWQPIAEEFLISIFTIPKTPLPLLEFSLPPENLGDQGVEKYIKFLIVELETLQNEVKRKMSNYFLVDENSLTKEQLSAFAELVQREII